MYQGRRVIKRILQKSPAILHNKGILGWFSSKEELIKHLNSIDKTIIETSMIVQKTVGFREDIGFIRQYLVFPKLIS